MELITKKEVGKFLDKSDHNYIRSKKLNSLSIREYLEVLEEKFCVGEGAEDVDKQSEHVENFVKLVDEEKTTFLDRAYAEIREAEMTPYEHRQRRLAQEAEAK